MNQLVPMLAPNEDVQHVGTVGSDRRCRSEITPEIHPTTPCAPVEEAMNQLVAMLAPHKHVQIVRTAGGHRRPGSEVPPRLIQPLHLPPSKKR